MYLHSLLLAEMLGNFPTPTMDFLIRWHQKPMGVEFLSADGQLNPAVLERTGAPYKYGIHRLEVNNDEVYTVATKRSRSPIFCRAKTRVDSHLKRKPNLFVAGAGMATRRATRDYELHSTTQRCLDNTVEERTVIVLRDVDIRNLCT